MNSKAMAIIDENTNYDDIHVYQGKELQILNLKNFIQGPVLKPKFEENPKKQNPYLYCNRCGESNVNRTSAKRKFKRKRSIGGRKRNETGLFTKNEADDVEVFKAKHTHCHKKCVNCSEIFADIEEGLNGNLGQFQC